MSQEEPQAQPKTAKAEKTRAVIAEAAARDTSPGSQRTMRLIDTTVPLAPGLARAWRGGVWHCGKVGGMKPGNFLI